MNMKFKNLTLVLVVVLMASVFTPALAKNPFADVPADHWAYDSVVELAAAGLIEGYPDGSFAGSRMMTRYEAAMVFARALSRLESQIGQTDLLAELDAIKAELVEEINAQLAAAGKPVETRVVEKVGLDEAELARIRAAEIAAEALEGDIAYLENRVLGLVDGIRYDVDQLQEQVAGLEQPSMEEIEALIAARVEEGLLDAALSAKEVVKETTVVEKIVATELELTEEDVEAIAEAMIAEQLQKYDIQIRENRELIVGLLDRVDAIEEEQVAMDARIAELEKVTFGGKLEFEGKYESGEDYKFKQASDLNVNIKASDTVNIKAELAYTLKPFANKEIVDTITNYGVTITSKSPVESLYVGKVAKAKLNVFSDYVLKSEDYAFGGIAKVNIIDDLTLNVFGGQKVSSDSANTDTIKAALALEYRLMDEFNLKLTGALDKPHTSMFDNYAAGVGIFGEIANIEYTGDFAMDFAEETEKNFLAAGTLATEFAGLSLDGAFGFREENYKIDTFEEGGKWFAEAGAGYEFLGIDLGGRYYYESDGDAALANAYKIDASASLDGFGLPLPLTVSARYAGSNVGDDPLNNVFAKIALAKEADLGLSYGASAAYEMNVIEKTDKGVEIWRNHTSYKAKGEQDEATFAGNVGYNFDWRGALVELGYDAEFVLPVKPEGVDSTLSHGVEVGYNFTDNVKLTLGGGVDHTFADELQNAFNYKAGVSVKF